VGFHGYAENAERHLEKLRRIPGAGDWVVCAVGGLHRFYHPKTQEVIASWMTRQDREQAIDDNVRYVAAVISRLRREEGTSEVLALAGFSQGVAMAYRAALGCGLPCHGVLALAGDVPPDVAALRPPAFPPVLLGRGTADGWYTEEKMDADLAALEAAGAAVTPCVFDGGHDWTDAYYEAAGQFLETIRNEGGG
jgi:predicted esterase